MKENNIQNKVFIYFIKNNLKNKTGYIGYTKNIINRYKAHLKNNNIKIHLCAAIKKYGKENFEINVIFECNIKNCGLYEKYFIFLYKKRGYTLYNMTGGGEGSCCIKHHSNETIRKISESLKGHKVSIETRRKLAEFTRGKSPGNKNKKISDETRKRLSISHIGKLKNIPKSIETRKKISIAHIGKFVSEKEKIRLQNLRKGKNHTAESKVKMSIANKGKVTWNKGIPMSEEAKKKMIITRKFKKILMKTFKLQPGPRLGVLLKAMSDRFTDLENTDENELIEFVKELL